MGEATDAVLQDALRRTVAWRAALAAALPAGSRAAAPRDGAPEPGELRARRLGRAERKKRVFERDLLACPRRQGRMRLIASVVQREVIVAILRCLRLPTEALPTAPARAPPQQELDLIDPDRDEPAR